MKKLITADGTEVLLDDFDYEQVVALGGTWRVRKYPSGQTHIVATIWYPQRRMNRQIYLHRVLFSKNMGKGVFFKNGNIFDYRRSNLQVKSFEKSPFKRPTRFIIGDCLLTPSASAGKRCGPSYNCPRYLECLDLVGDTDWPGWVARRIDGIKKSA